MNLQLKDDKILITLDSSEKSDQLKAFLEKHEKHIFQVQKEGESIALVRIGDRATACNESINVLFSSENETIRLISNLGHTPFEMDNLQYESVEGFWQSLKYEEAKREDIAKL